MRIVVTGAAGSFGRVLVPRLCECDWVDEVLGVDRAESKLPAHPKYTFRRGDIREASSWSWMRDAEALIHMAFVIVQPAGAEREVSDINIVGSMETLRAARDAGIRKIINISSASVYGRGIDVDESAPLAPSIYLPYACHKAEVERRADSEIPNIIHLRPAFLLGPHAVPFIKRIFSSRLYVALPAPVPKVQVVHEDDVAEAVLAVLQRDLPGGAFNLAAPEVVSVAEMVKNGGRLTVGVPIRWIERLVGPLPAPGLPIRPSHTLLDLARVTLTLSCHRAHQTLGWKPHHSAWSAQASA